MHPPIRRCLGGENLNWAESFLVERDPDGWAPPKGFPAAFKTHAAFFQRYDGRVVANGLEVVLASSDGKPQRAQVRDGYLKRRGGRASPVLMLVGYPAGLSDRDHRISTGAPTTAASVRLAACGPAGDDPAVLLDLSIEQVERVVDCALGEPDQHAAIRLLQRVLSGLDAPAHARLEVGLRNVGLLATQELRAGLPQRSDWEEAVRAGRSVLGLRGRRLVEGLGFRVEQHASHVHLLKVNGHSRAAAVFCSDDEPFDAPARRLDGITPVSLALSHASEHGADWVVLTRGSEIRLYAARPDTGVGRKGRAETFVEANLALLDASDAGYVHLLFSAEALDTGGKIEEVLEASDRFAVELAVRLRDRVYAQTVPALAAAVAKRMGPEPSPDDLRAAYERVMVILFRLLFVAYAEARDLFPYLTNARYADHSLTRLVARLTEDRRDSGAVYDETAASMWADITQLWSAIDSGNVAWGLPAYDGGLFSRDPAVSPSGAAIDALAPLSDAELAPALSAMLVDHGSEGEGPVDFRSVSVRTFGTIYEGLLESQLSLAEQDLTVRDVRGADTFVPAREGDTVEVAAGSVYFHNRSGVRKSTGSYFTKGFAVKHLLDHALEPALDDHLSRLDELAAAGDTAAVEAAFFDFRCADIAMGSGHFLVAAVDRIEARLLNWLSRNASTAAGIHATLSRLRAAAVEALGELGGDTEIETGMLLRRQVARSCIYGVDLNRVAVELARLSIWVHTFVPGLPLSFLDHNLVEGNSLTGIGTLDEVLRILERGGKHVTDNTFIRAAFEQMLLQADDALRRLARTSDATKSEIEEAREAHEDALAAVAPAIASFDVVSAYRAGACDLPDFATTFDPADFERVFEHLAARREVQEAVGDLKPVHFPARFPEVFRREERSGFDCLIGNPPWEKVVADREVWWGMHLPGVRSLPVAKRRAAVSELEHSRPDLAAQFDADKKAAESLKRVLRAAFPNLGSGQTDLYKAFSWANLELARQGGRIGIVLPRTAVSDAGMAKWRLHVTDVESLSLSLGRRSRGFGCRCSPSSTTRDGCSMGSTTPTRWRSSQSYGHLRRHLSQHRPVGLRRCRRSLHRGPHRSPQGQRSSRAQEVALKRHLMSRM
ncbi:MAG: hypothetical protein OXC00_02205 [Acidimicrobiaceae bacterium]|nr:hypothetical protein [Acidimicrobiaceae bacterium]